MLELQNANKNVFLHGGDVWEYENKWFCVEFWSYSLLHRLETPDV